MRIGGKSSDEPVCRLRSAPSATDPIAPAVMAVVVGSLVAQTGLLNSEIACRDARDAFGAHPKAAVLEDLPRVATASLPAHRNSDLS